MKKKALWKDIWKTIWNNKARFLALFAIILLGVGFYAGISATGPDMLDTANRYYDNQRLFDLRVLSTYGIEEDDSQALVEVDDIFVQPIRTIDVMMEESEYLLRLFPHQPDSQQLNDFQLVSGRLPEKSGEIALDAIRSLQENFSIGDRIQFQMEPADEEDEEELDIAGISVKDQVYTVVGFVHSPLFIEEVGRGNSQVGKGSLDGFATVLEADITGDIYSEMYIRFEDQAELFAYTDEYRDYLDDKMAEIELALNGRPLERINEIRTEGRKEIFDGRQELEEARQQLADAGEELAQARQELDDAIRLYEENRAKFEQEIALAEQEIAAQQQTIDQGWREYEAGVAEWESGARQYADAKTNWEIQREVFLQQIDGSMTLEELAANPLPTPEGEQLAAEIKYLLDGEEDIERAKSQLQTHLQTLQDQEIALENAQQQLDADKIAMQELSQEIETDRAALEQRKQTLVERQEQLQLVQGFLADPAEEKVEQVRIEITAQGNRTLVYQPFLDYLDGLIEVDAVPTGQEETLQAQMQLGIDEGQAALTEKENELATIAEREKELLEQGQILENAKSLYSTNVRNLEQQATELQRARSILQNEINQALQDIQAQVAAADRQFSEQGTALQNARTELENARTELEAGQIQLNNGRDELAREKATGESALADAWQQIQTGEVEYADGLATYEAEHAEAEEEIRDAEVALNKAVDELRRLEEPVYFVQNRSVNPGYEGYGDNANRISAIASIFPVFFFLIAALVSFTTMTRMVDEQRQLMGTLKGLGYSSMDIAKKFLVYAGIACAAGTVLGLLAGYHLFPTIIYRAYSSLYNLPDIQINYYLSFGLTAFLVALLCTVGPAALATFRSLRENPASLMRPKAPKKGKRVFLERIPFIWRKLGFNAKITVRNLVRYKVRNSMTIIGVAGCMALILTGFAVKNSISGLADTQFDEIMRYDAVIAFQPDLTTSERNDYQNEINRYPEITHHLPVLQSAYRAEKRGLSTQEVTLFVPENPQLIGDFVSLQERDRAVTHSLTDEGAIISEKLAILFEIGPGDDLVMKDDEQMTYTIPVQAVTENYTGHYIYLSPQMYESIFSERFEPNMGLIRYEADADWEATFAENMMNTDQVSLITFMDVVDRAFADTLGSLDIITLVLIISAAALAFVVLYNLTNINVSERIRELSTIKVLGFYHLEVSMYIYRETFILTILGILFGFLFGNGLATLLLKMVEVDFMLFPITILPSSYLLSTILTMTFSFIVMVIMHYKLKNVDMMESLKSVE